MKLDCARGSVTVSERCALHKPVCTSMYKLPLTQSDGITLSLFQSVYNNWTKLMVCLFSSF